MENRERPVPLSVREGRREPFKQAVGVPPYMRRSIREWFELAAKFFPEPERRRLEYRISRITRLERTFSFAGASGGAFGSEPDELFEAIDLLLFLKGEYLSRCTATTGSVTEMLDEILWDVDHEYRLDADNKRLVKRVDETVWAAYEKALSADDRASEWIASAWAKTYSRDCDPSGAWEDARKAVEEVLKPIVSPNNAKATISSMIKEIREGEHKWDCDLRGSDWESSILQFARSLEVIGFPGDHHGGGDGKVEPEVSRTAVLQAVAVVGWLRDGAFRRIEKA